MIAPNSTIRLLRSDLELDNSNQLTFSNLSAQTTYFLSKAHVEVEDATYQRKDNVIRFPALIDDIITYNYVMYKNESYSNKWFYAYIESMEYLNDNMTLIKIKTDVFQTWQFDIVYKKSFVEREHVNDDTKGKHTIDEGLGTGEYFSTLLQPESHGGVNNAPCYVISTAKLGPGMSYGTLNEAIPNGNYYIAFKTVEAVKDFCSYFNSQALDQNINGVFIAPQEFFSSWATVNIDGTDYEYSTHLKYNYAETYTIARPTYLSNNYVPKNNKLFCYPYSFLQVSNNTGVVVNYKYEDFIDITTGNPADVSFRCLYALDVGCSIKMHPVMYRNMVSNLDESIVMGKLPVGSYNSDTYTNWLTQNSVNIAGDLLMSHANLLTSAGGMTGKNVVSTAANTFDILAEMNKASFMPNQVRGNVNCGDVNYLYGLTTFTFKRMCVKNEYAKIIDDFFTMYGYKVNSLKVPNVTGRRNWNYVKTIGVNLEGAIPQDDVQELKSIFNNGVTFWHNGSNFLDYSQNNDII